MDREERDMGARRKAGKARLGWLAAGAVLALLALPAAQASAARSHLLKEVFGSAQQPNFGGSSVMALAVDQASGDVLVATATSGESRAKVTRWKSNGEPDPFPALGTNVIDAAPGPGGKPCAEEPSSCDAAALNKFEGFYSEATQIAIDESGKATDGDIYVLDTLGKRVDIFAADGHFLGELRKFGTKNMGEPDGLAVDADGNVYVSDNPKNAVHKFVPTANPVTSANFTTDFTAVERPQSLAVGAGPSAGSLFVARHSGNIAPEFTGGLFKLTLSNGELQYAIAEGELQPDGIRTIAVDPGNGHLFAGYKSKFDEYDASGASAATLLSSTAAAENTLFDSLGLAVNAASGEVYLSSSEKLTNNFIVFNVAVFGAPIVTLPDVVTSPTVSAITPSKGTVHGTVNPAGQALTECKFEYLLGTSGPFTNTVPCAESPAEIGEGTSPVAVEARISGLEARSPASFRLVAENANNDPIFGAGRSFSTTQVLETLPATEVGGVKATLNGTVNPDGGPVSGCLFEYGTTTAYGKTVPCVESEAEIGSGESPVPVHADLTGLNPETTYRFRLAATTVTVDGSYHNLEDQAFITSSESTVKTLAASEVGGTVATLNGTVNPAGVPVGECLFEYGTTTAYGKTVPCAESEAEIGAGSAPVHVHAKVSGLQAGAVAYHFRLLAGPGGVAVKAKDEQLLTLGPKVAAEWAASVTTGEATLKAEIEPNGAATGFHLEWGPAADPLAHDTAEASVSGNAVSVNLAGLEAGSAYRYRFAASSHCNPLDPAELCVVTGPERDFATYVPTALDTNCPNQPLRTGPSARLPDCRAYEMVSPIDKNGGDVGTGAVRLAQAAPDGQLMTFSSLTAFAGAESSPLTSQYLSSRDPRQGWSTRSITPPIDSAEFYPTAGYNKFPFTAFSEDLCSGWVLQGNDLALAPESPPHVPNLYRRLDCGEEGYELLTTAAPPGYGFELFADLDYVPLIGGFSADASRSVFSANAALTPDAVSAKGVYQVYEAYDGGRLRLVSILPNGEATATYTVVGTGADMEDIVKGASDYHAVSEDASRVYWTDSENGTGTPGNPGNADGPGKLYLRVNAAEPQSKVSAGRCVEAARACTYPVSSEPAHFWLASPDGSRAIFSARSGNGESLFEFSAEEESGGTKTEANLIAEAAVGVMGASEDATRVYFVSTKALTGGQENSEGDKAEEGKPNLYLYERGAGVVFIATLGPKDVANSMGRGGYPSPIQALPSKRTARVSADGLRAVFTSEASLTGFDNADASSGVPDAEVFRFDATANAGKGQLLCLSCNPSGARPSGREVQVSGTGKKESDVWAAAQIPGWQTSLYPTRALSADGNRVFFNSFDALTLADTNGREDVYQWEAPGSGDCSEESSSYSAANGGCLSLISSGESAEDAEFFDATPSGEDAFFATQTSLLPQDLGSVDLYDARVGGGFPQPTSAASCEGEACQSAPEAPNDPTPASSSFEGAGNVREEPVSQAKPCGKGKVRRKGRCVAKRHKRAKRHRRAGR